MSILFDKESAISAVLYILGKFGGTADMHKVYKTLYFADQEHLSKYGRSITGDTYIAMQYGPVPSNLYDIAKALRGDSFFSDSCDTEEFRGVIGFQNKFTLKSLGAYDGECLSESDLECLDHAVEKCAGKSFQELTCMSHGIAYSRTSPDREISVKDILREAGDTDEYAEFISDRLKFEKSLCS